MNIKNLSSLKINDFIDSFISKNEPYVNFVVNVDVNDENCFSCREHIYINPYSYLRQIHSLQLNIFGNTLFSRAWLFMYILTLQSNIQRSIIHYSYLLVSLLLNRRYTIAVK